MFIDVQAHTHSLALIYVIESLWLSLPVLACVYIHYKNNHILVIINNILAVESPRWSSTHANGACLHSCCSLLLLLLPDRMQSNANMRWPAAGSGEYEDHDDDDENVCSINKHPSICNIAPTHTDKDSKSG